MFDTILSGATVIDGSGRPGFTADVGISRSRIDGLGDLGGAASRERIDVTGAVVCPGFIDIHSHSDLCLAIDPRAEGKVRQGVTTEVIGNCGFSPAPLTERNRDALVASEKFLGEVVSAGWPMGTMGEYLGELRRRGLGLNVAALLGHQMVRSAVTGFERRYTTGEEVERMRSIVQREMAGGLFGISTGLIYPPGSYADTEELVAIAEVAARSGGVYSSHIRGEGVTLLRAVAEAIEIGERAGIPVEISHHKASGRSSWGRVRDTMAMIDAARNRGADVSVDVYPYSASSTDLSQIVPEWAHEGGVGRLVERLRDPEIRARILAQVHRQPRDWESVIISWVASAGNKPLEGRTIRSIAEERQVEPPEAVCDLLVEENGRASMIAFAMAEDDVRYVLAHPAAMIGSDGSALSPPPSPLGEGKPHPRNYGTFPRVLGQYVRKEGLLGLEEAVHKMTGMPSAKLGLRRKGRIQVGCDADLVVFDPETVSDRATYEDPHRFPEGVLQVLVNGAFAVRDGDLTGTLAGRVLVRGEI